MPFLISVLVVTIIALICYIQLLKRQLRNRVAECQMLKAKERIRENVGEC